MPNSSINSLNYRLEWRPSRYFVGAYYLLSLAIALALSISQIPWYIALIFSVFCGLLLIRQALRYWRQPAILLVMEQGSGKVVLADRTELVESVLSHDAGFVVGLYIRLPEARTMRLSWWPDTLDQGLRRQLKLFNSMPTEQEAP